MLEADVRRLRLLLAGAAAALEPFAHQAEIIDAALAALSAAAVGVINGHGHRVDA